MARLYAQFAAVVFLAFGLGGLLTGDAGTLVHHHPAGNLGPMTLHLTYARDILNLVLAGVLGYSGFRAGDRVAGEIVLGVGVVLLLLAGIGFANADNATGHQHLRRHRRGARRALRRGPDGDRAARALKLASGPS